MTTTVQVQLRFSTNGTTYNELIKAIFKVKLQQAEVALKTG